jgi:predicted nucleic acid-binding protein
VPRIALDTNILAYSEGLNRGPTDADKVILSRQLLRALNGAGERWVAATQVLAELHSVLVRRAALPPREASDRVRRLQPFLQQVETSPQVLDAALGLSGAHNLQIYDALILAAAANARCDLLVSEDMHDGFVWSGITVTNPFGASPDARISGLLTPGP